MNRNEMQDGSDPAYTMGYSDEFLATQTPERGE